MTDEPDVLFLVLDSARKDRLSTYGHGRATTPALDRLAETATTFENAFTPAPWTLPAHCSMFTGTFPSEHGVTNGFTDRDLRLPADVRTVTELLAKRGYRTAGFSNNPWVGRLSGLTRGFDEFVEWDLEISRSSSTGIHGRRARGYSRGHELLGHATRQPIVLLKRRFFTGRLVSRARRWLSATKGPTPTFTFLNLMEAHSPYYPPRRAFQQLGLEPANPIEARLLNYRLLANVMGKGKLSPGKRERLMEFYDASLRYQDTKVEELLSLLEAEESFDDALVVVCADHGKTLGDYDRNGSPPHYLRDVNVNVPLLVKWPGQEAGERVDEPFELTNLFHLIRDGGDASISDVKPSNGMALTEDFLPHTGRSSEPVTRWRALSDGEYTLLASEEGEEYLLERGDRNVVVDGHGDVLTRFRDALDARESGMRRAMHASDEQEGTMGRAVEGQLRDLGYLD